MNLKDKLFAKLDKPTLTPCEFAGETVYIRAWSEREKIEWALSMKELTSEEKQDVWVRCRAIAWSVADADGHLLFKPSEYERVADFPSSEITKLFDAVIQVQVEPDAKKN